VEFVAGLTEGTMTVLEEHLGFALPPMYRDFLRATNGAWPYRVSVLPEFGFVADQKFFGLGGEDYHQDLIGANNWLRDRLTPDYWAIGYVQGGIIAVKVRGPDADSIWYWDDDDPRDDDAYDAAYICANLLYRVADDVSELWSELALPAADLLAVVDDLVRDGTAIEVRPDLMGAWLPANRRASWQTGAASGVGDDVLAEFDATKRSG
jgi:hypothetical protein